MGNPREIRIYSRADCAVFRKTAEAFGGLSNMAPGFPVRINGVRILTVEALYQACRFPHLPEVQRKIIAQTSPMTAKMVGKPYRDDSRPDWDRVRVKIMRWVLRLKLAMHWTQFSALLLSTGGKPIVEDSRKDDFWGAIPTDATTLVGMNVLGRLLMELREEIKQGVELRRVEPPEISDFLLYAELMGVVDFRNDKSKPYPVEMEATHHAVNDFSMSLFADHAPDTSRLQPRTTDGHEGARTAYQGLTVNLKPYSDYKESGLPWLGRCPKHWSLRRTKTLFAERVQKGFPNEPLLAATQTKGVVRKVDYGTRTVTAQKDLHLLKLVEPGDYVISLRSFQGGIEFAHYRGIISPAYTVLQPRADANLGYYTHFFKSRQFIDSLSLFVTGIREGQNIDYERMSRAEMPLPPMDEQVAIVRFLSHANQKIDGFIRAKCKLIALLNEQKQAIIHRAVTRGVDSNVRIKSSGILAIGDIPAHWEVLRTRFLFRAVTRRDVRSDDPKMSVTQRRGLVRTDEMEEKSTQAKSFDRFQVCHPQDLVLNKYKAHLGVFCCAFQRGLITTNYTVFRPTRPLRTHYFDLLFHTITYRNAFRMLVYGVTEGMSPLYTQDFYRVPALFPPVEEQLAIVNAITDTTKVQDEAIARTEREISLMQEYRARLTADVVTGKLDVREAAAKLPDLLEDPMPEAITEEAMEEIEAEES